MVRRDLVVALAVVALAILTVTAGCAARSRDSGVTVVELPPPPETAAEPPSQAHPPRKAACTTIGKVRVGHVQLTNPACSIDSLVHEGDIGEVQQCQVGAVLVFEHGTFTGNLQGARMNLHATTRFSFSDGCTWQSEQRIEGAEGGGSGGELVFTYAERPVQGTSCAPNTCTARASVAALP